MAYRLTVATTLCKWLRWCRRLPREEKFGDRKRYARNLVPVDRSKGCRPRRGWKDGVREGRGRTGRKRTAWKLVTCGRVRVA